MNKCKSYKQIVIHTAEKVKKHNCPNKAQIHRFSTGCTGNSTTYNLQPSTREQRLDGTLKSTY